MAICKYYMHTKKSSDWMHTDNEDYMMQTRFCFMNDVSMDVLVIADGMGGMEAGKEASRVCAQAFTAAFYREVMSLYEPGQKNFTLLHYCENLKTAISDAFVEANAAVVELVKSGLRTGTTLSVAVVLGNYMIVANVGDSPVYFYENADKSMKLVSRLMTLAEAEAKKGDYPYFSDAYYAHDHILLEFMGQYATLPIRVINFYVQEKVENGDMLLLGSDGAFGRRSPEEILALLDKEDAYQALPSLFARAEMDKADDQTAIWVKF